jgi:hypothetical protein
LRRVRSWLAASRRRRTRLLWALSLLASGVVVACLVVFLRDTGHQYPSGPTKAEGAAQVYVAPRDAPLGRDGLLAAQATLRAFLSTAVLRQQVADSFALVTPKLRSGYTRATWSRGEIPIIPYPVDVARVRYHVDYSYEAARPGGPRRLGLDVAMTARRGARVAPIVFTAELQAFGTGPRRHWLVAYWAPKGVLGGEPPVDRPPGPAPPQARRLSVIWLVIPGMIIGSILLLPVAFLLRSWARERRIARTYSSF